MTSGFLIFVWHLEIPGVRIVVSCHALPGGSSDGKVPIVEGRDGRGDLRIFRYGWPAR